MMYFYGILFTVYYIVARIPPHTLHTNKHFLEDYVYWTARLCPTAAGGFYTFLFAA